MRKPFSFGLVRYVHDPVSEEFLNVGVVVYSPMGGYLKARCTRRYGRLSNTFGEVRGQHFRSLMGFIQRRVNELGRRLESSDSDLPADPMAVVRSLFAIDDSSIQFSNGGGGLAEDFDSALNSLYERYVGKFESETGRRRGDSDVWRDYRPRFDELGIVEHLTAHIVRSTDFSYEFDRAWKNGVWNAIEPVSLDLSSPQKIRDKANKWLGRTVNLAEAPDDLKLFFLLGPPSGSSMKTAYDQAKDILHKSPIPHQLIEEDEVEDFAKELRDQIRDHGENGLGLDHSPTAV